MPFVMLCAAAGFVLGWARLRGSRLDPWAAVAGGVAFVALMAPVVSGGSATFTSYTTLDDSVVHFSLPEHVLSNGHALPASGGDFAEVVKAYLSTDYPSAPTCR